MCSPSALQGELEGAKPASNRIKCRAKPCSARRAWSEASIFVPQSGTKITALFQAVEKSRRLFRQPERRRESVSFLRGRDKKKTPKRVSFTGASGDTELFEKASNINGFQGGRVANNLYISPFRTTVFKTAALFLYLNSSVVIRVRKPLFFPL